MAGVLNKLIDDKAINMANAEAIKLDNESIDAYNDAVNLSCEEQDRIINLIKGDMATRCPNNSVDAILEHLYTAKENIINQ